jgi:hypothetical protein
VHWFAQQVPGPTQVVPSGAHPGGAQWPPLHWALQHSEAVTHVAPSGLQAGPLLEELLVELELAVALALDVVDALALEVDEVLEAPVLELLARVVELVLVGAPPAPSPKWMPLLEHPPSSEAAITIAKRCVLIPQPSRITRKVATGKIRGESQGSRCQRRRSRRATGCCAWRSGRRPLCSPCSPSAGLRGPMVGQAESTDSSERQGDDV